MSGYYDERLAAEKLLRAYEIAPPRVKQYLEAEIEFALSYIKPTDTVLELGCGYGRVLERMAQKAARAVGIDTSLASLRLAHKADQRKTGIYRVCFMDAVNLGFRDNGFDIVACLQNGLSAFHADQRQLVKEALRVARPGGKVLFSSYSDKFWDDRLKWFELQARHGLLGEIDYMATGNGVITCKDGFTATTVTPDQFRNLTAGLEITPVIEEVDDSSLFCIMTP